jgi:putative transposase
VRSTILTSQLPVSFPAPLSPLAASFLCCASHGFLLKRVKELDPEARPQIISGNGPQFIARDFNEFIRVSGMTHVRASPYYSPSKGKIERWHKSLKGECIRPGTPLSLEDAQRLVKGCVEHYNDVCSNSAIGYITPKDMVAGR